VLAGRATVIDRSAAAAAAVAVAVAGALRFRGAITGIQKRRVEVSEAQQVRPGRAGQGTTTSTSSGGAEAPRLAVMAL
jgi:hypothetical protein